MMVSAAEAGEEEEEEMRKQSRGRSRAVNGRVTAAMAGTKAQNHVELH
jgi:hypothetical protein